MRKQRELGLLGVDGAGPSVRDRTAAIGGRCCDSLRPNGAREAEHGATTTCRATRAIEGLNNSERFLTVLLALFHVQGRPHATSSVG